MRDRRGKFVELANKRVNKAIAQLRLVGNLSNRAAYEFSEEDVRRIVKALQKELDSVRSRFSDNAPGADLEFQL